MFLFFSGMYETSSVDTSRNESKLNCHRRHYPKCTSINTTTLPKHHYYQSFSLHCMLLQHNIICICSHYHHSIYVRCVAFLQRHLSVNTSTLCHPKQIRHPYFGIVLYYKSYQYSNSKLIIALIYIPLREH